MLIFYQTLHGLRNGLLVMGHSEGYVTHFRGHVLLSLSCLVKCLVTYIHYLMESLFNPQGSLTIIVL